MALDEIISTLDTCCAEAIKNLRAKWDSSVARRTITEFMKKEQYHASDR